MKTKMLLAAAVGLLTLGGAGPALAQVEIEPEAQSHRVRVVNEMGQPIRFKFIGFQKGAFFEADLRANADTTQQFYAGERVVCVWDTSARLLMAVRLNVNSDGKLRLRPVVYARPVGSTVRATEASKADVLPQVELEKD